MIGSFLTLGAIGKCMGWGSKNYLILYTPHKIQDICRGKNTPKPQLLYQNILLIIYLLVSVCFYLSIYLSICFFLFISIYLSIYPMMLAKARFHYLALAWNLQSHTNKLLTWSRWKRLWYFLWRPCFVERRHFVFVIHDIRHYFIPRCRNMVMSTWYGKPDRITLRKQVKVAFEGDLSCRGCHMSRED